MDTCVQASPWLLIGRETNKTFIKLSKLKVLHTKFLLLLFRHEIFLPSRDEQTKRPGYGTNSSPGAFRRLNPRWRTHRGKSLVTHHLGLNA